MNGGISPFKARELKIAIFKHSSFKTGSMPGRAKSTKFAWMFASANCDANEFEKSLCFEFI